MAREGQGVVAGNSNIGSSQISSNTNMVGRVAPFWIPDEDAPNCQECRLKKCYAMGMRPECVVPESQCALKRRAKEPKPSSGSSGGSDNSGGPESKRPKVVVPLKPEEEELINRLVYFQDEFEQPSGEDLKRID